jgi:hypothetical protein
MLVSYSLKREQKKYHTETAIVIYTFFLIHQAPTISVKLAPITAKIMPIITTLPKGGLQKGYKPKLPAGVSRR